MWNRCIWELLLEITVHARHPVLPTHPLHTHTHTLTHTHTHSPPHTHTHIIPLHTHTHSLLPLHTHTHTHTHTLIHPYTPPHRIVIPILILVLLYFTAVVLWACFSIAPVKKECTRTYAEVA